MQRVTQSMMSTTLLRNLNNNMLKMNNLQTQLSSGMRINKPSDDPVGLTLSLRYRTELESNQQYQANAKTALSWMEHTDTLLDQAGDVVLRFRELALSAANDTKEDVSLGAIKEEMQQLYEQMVSIGNSQFKGHYVFGGQVIDKKPYDPATAATDEPDQGIIKYELGSGVMMGVNITGQAVFGESGESTNIFQIMQDMIQAVDPAETSVPKRKIDDALGRLDVRFDGFLEKRSEIGAKVNRAELSLDRLKDGELSLEDMRAGVESADIARVLIDLKTSDNVYQASLSIGSQIIRPSLMDFLR